MCATRHQNSPPCNTVNCQVRCFSFVQQPKVQGCPCSCGNGGGDSSSQEEAHTAQHQRCPPMDRSRLPLRAHSLTLRAVRAQALLTGGRRHAAVAWQGGAVARWAQLTGCNAATNKNVISNRQPNVSWPTGEGHLGTGWTPAHMGQGFPSETPQTNLRCATLLKI